MFGLLRPDPDLLDCRQRSAWSGHLCAACHAMAGFGGRPAALLAGYDAAFWALVAGSLLAPDPTARRLPCTALPFLKVAVSPLPQEAAETLAALNLLLVQAKLEDDQADGDGAGGRLLSWALRSRVRRARTHLADRSFPLADLEELPRRQSRAEQAREPHLAGLEEPTAAAMRSTFAVVADLAGRSELAAPLRELGDALGRTLYLADAVLDLPQDLRRGRFNALASCGREPSLGRLARHLDRLERALRALPLGERLPVALSVAENLRSRLGLRVQARPRGCVRVQCDDCGCGCCCSACDVSACEACAACCHCPDPCTLCCVWLDERRASPAVAPPPEEEPPATVYLD